jgi:hypothetical protein
MRVFLTGGTGFVGSNTVRVFGERYALRAGRRFTVWESHEINGLATPTLASDAAELLRRVVDGRHEGILRCVGGESVDRVTLARRTAEAFGLDVELLEVGPPDPIEAHELEAAA